MADQAPQQGWGQMTAAQRQIISSGYSTQRRTSGARKKSSRTKSRTKPRKRASSSGSRSKKSSTLKRLVKGSKAAKAYMAKIRKKRK